MQETLSVSGVLLTKTSGRQSLAFRKFQGENERMTETSVKMTMIMKVFFNMIGLTFSITPVLVYWLAGWLLVGRGDRSSLNIGTIVAFTALQSRLFFPLTNLLNVQVEVMSSLALFDRIFEYLDAFLRTSSTRRTPSRSTRGDGSVARSASSHVGVPV